MFQNRYVLRIARKMAVGKQFLFPAMLSMLIMAAILTFLPIQIQHILQAVYIAHDESQTFRAILTVAVLVIIYIFFGYAGQFWVRKAEYQLSLKIHNDLFEKLLYLPAGQYASLNKFLAIKSILSHINHISRTTAYITTVLMRDTMALLGLVACLIFLHKEFAVLVGILIPFSFLMLQIITEQQTKTLDVDMQTTRHQPGKLADRVHYVLEHFREIRLFGGQRQEQRNLSEAIQSLLKDDNQLENYQTFITILCQFLLFLIVIAVTFLLIRQNIENTLTLDQTIAFVSAVLLLITPMKRLAGIPQMLHRIRKPLEQLFALLDLPTVSIHDPVSLTGACGKLTFENIHMVKQHKSGQAVYSLNLTIKAGETVALVAASPATRQMLLDLMLGFSVPTMGKMRLDEQPYTTIDSANLLAQFAVVPKTPVILDDRVAGNIAYGDTECAHEARITMTAQQTRVSRFVREMPEGLQTRVDMNGASLTAKQWRLIAMARALLKNAPILIIDDLWIRRESDLSDDVFSVLTQIMQNRTNILLLQSVPEYRAGIDQIIVVENGENQEN